MTDITLARELNAYKKMYRHIFNIVTSVIEECQDTRAKYRLIKAQQYTEDIYTGESIRPPKMTVDEETIVVLLRVIIEQESKKSILEQDVKLMEECEDWILDLEEDRITQFILDFEKEMKELKEQNKKR